jgi:hypothetical protein
MPKVDIDYETLDGFVVVGLKDMLNTLIEQFRRSQIEEDKLDYAKDIEALERVLRLYQ